MRKSIDWFDSHDVSVLVVTFEQEWRAKQYVDETGIEFPLCINRDRNLYQAFGMERGTKRKVLGIGNWWAYIKLMMAGQKLHSPTDDIYQLGGDVLIDPHGIVRFHFVSETPVDRPSVAEIQAARTNA
ncbi:MAG: AhpC/TSA family protein [Planctomycetales bacterium]|nr:AhpC/TSA family protein [Planctomycetales bacterium]